MVNQMGESLEMSSANIGNTESIGEAAIVLISIGSILVILCAATVIYALRRRRYPTTATMRASLAESNVPNPTDFMRSLATWDPVDEMLEKRRRSVWTLEVCEKLQSVS